jgi:hypothetical protein
MTWDKAKYYLKGTLILILCFGMVLVSCYGLASSTNTQTRVIFYSVFFSVMGATLLAYWAYGFIRELKAARANPDPEDPSNPYKNKYRGNKKK